MPTTTNKVKYNPETNQIEDNGKDITDSIIGLAVEWLIANEASMVVINKTTQEEWAIVTTNLGKDKAIVH